MIDFRQVRAGGDITINVPGTPQVVALPPEPKSGYPPDPIAHFTGREHELATLHDQLSRHRRVVIQGLGGVGKTELAVQYIDRHRDEYPEGTFWLRGEELTILTSDLAGLAWQLRLPERELPQHELQIEAVLRWLRQRERWLLVIDNLDEPVMEALRHWLPPGLPGQVLVTSRSPLWSAHLVLEPLDPELATRFLLERTGQTDENTARILADRLGGLPLALEQASAYLEETGNQFSSYTRLLERNPGDLLEWMPANHAEPVARTWSLSFQRVEAYSPLAADLLRLCALFAPDDIPIRVLVAGAAAPQLSAELRAALGDDLRFNMAIAVLRRYSLVSRQADRLGVHRLVQEVVRESLRGQGHRKVWAGSAVGMLATVFPETDQTEAPATWAECEELLPHALAVASYGIEEGTQLTQCASLLVRAATYLRARAEFGSARALYERALTIYERVLGPDHPDVAEVLNRLAYLLRGQSDLAAARPHLERALGIWERVRGPDHPDTAKGLNNLGSLLRDQGDLEAARPYQERALDIRKRLIPNHPHTAFSLNSIGMLLRAQGDLDGARSHLEEALAIRERVLGPQHPDTINSLNNLGSLLKDRGDWEAARALFQRALAVSEGVLGPYHPQTANSLDNMARLCQAEGDLGGAKVFFQRALAIRERVLGRRHPYTIASHQALEGVIEQIDKNGE